MTYNNQCYCFLMSQQTRVHENPFFFLTWCILLWRLPLCFTVKLPHKAKVHVNSETNSWTVHFRFSVCVEWCKLWRRKPYMAISHTLCFCLSVSPFLFLALSSLVPVSLSYSWIPHWGERKQERLELLLAAAFFFLQRTTLPLVMQPPHPHTHTIFLCW